MDPINEPSRLDRSTLLHGIYRALLNTGRTYAAFEDERVMPLVERLRDQSEILDPMSGYGSLTRYCAHSRHPVRSYCIEANGPSYLWQLLMHPMYCTAWIQLCRRILSCKAKWPRQRIPATLSDAWFPPESERILLRMWDLCIREAGECEFIRVPHVEYLALAFLLPFCGRLAAMIEGSVVTHVKMGGMCVYRDWNVDFERYVRRLLSVLSEHSRRTRRVGHTIVLGDCRRVTIPDGRFSAMITSPPYPNSRSYSSMFRPELDFIRLLEERGRVTSLPSQVRLIGSPIVSEDGGHPKRTIKDVKSRSARNFLAKLEAFRGTENAEYDIRVYYLPYFCNYFAAIEEAYACVASALAGHFEGYIIVVNNTARRTSVPVAEAVMETWSSLGFSARVEDEFSREVSHVGGMNPNVKGFSSRHMEHTIKVSR